MSNESEKLAQVIEAVKELLEDNTVPKNIKSKLEQVIVILQEEGELSIKINKVQNCFDEIVDDGNMESYTRTQLWNIVSLLEMI